MFIWNWGMKSKWESERENLTKLIEDGVSYEDIGRKYNCTGANIKKVAKTLGIKLPQRRSVNPSETFNKKDSKYCPNCGKEIPQRNKYCSNRCKLDFEYKTYIQKWLKGEESGTKCADDTSNYVRRYLFSLHNNSCQLCGWNKVNQHTGKVPLQIHHIDGDCKNNSYENLQLLCPNCHALTENFGSRNDNCTRVDKRVR